MHVPEPDMNPKLKKMNMTELQYALNDLKKKWAALESALEEFTKAAEEQVGRSKAIEALYSERHPKTKDDALEAKEEALRKEKDD